MSASIAARLFDGDRARYEIEALLDDATLTYEEIGWDHYDCSLEIRDVPPQERLSDDLQRLLRDAGFLTVYVNHTDKWETHYSWKAKKFEPVKGWRVSYPHKREDEEGSILIEEAPDSWPKDWFQSGKCKLVKP